MKNKEKLIRHCRDATAVVALAFLLSFSFDGVLAVVVKYLAFSLIILISGYDFKTFGKRPSKLYTLYSVLLMIAFTVFLSFVLPSNSDELSFDLLTVLSVVVLAPFFEELFFRGALVSFSNPWLTAFTSSAIFGIFHGKNSFWQAFLLGLILSCFYIASRNIAVPIICHSANNALALVCRRVDIRLPVLVISIIAIILIYKFTRERK